MTIKITPIPAYNDNYIWLIHNTRHAVVVDPGLSAPVEDYLDRYGLELTHILITHHHWDHVNGIESLQTKWSCPVYAPEDDRIPGQLCHVSEHDEIHLPQLGTRFTITTTPGHTLTHICYHNDQWLFCGDTLFSMGCGRMFEGSPEQYTQSLNKLKKLDPETLIYCTHEYTLSNLEFALSIEPDNKAIINMQEATLKMRQANLPSLPTTVKTQITLNPFLRTNEKELHHILSQKSNTEINNNVTCFAMLRKLKDEF